MTESNQPDPDALTSTPAGAAAGGESEDLHGVAAQVQHENQEGGAEEAAKTPG